MTYNEALQYIHSLMRFGSRPGLERILKLLELLKNPQEKLDVVHVAGTNGKGSTCAFLSNILRASGKKTGLYISPFITSFNERIQIDGVPISDEDLAEFTERVKFAVGSMPNDDCPITEFEFITAVAFLYFAEKNCDAVVLEVGLGGRLDATNVITKPKVSVITRIALDHTAVLGDTEAAIAYEKGGIIKPKSPVVTTAENSDEALAVIKDIAQSRGCDLHISQPQSAMVTSCDINGSAFVFEGEKYSVPLIGKHQISNAVNAVTAIKAVFPEIEDDVIKYGLKATTFPARCEVVSKQPLVILDGSHNPNGTAALDNMLSSLGVEKAQAIIGFMADKDVADAIKLVAGRFDKITTVKVQSNSRTMTAEDLAFLCKQYCSDVVTAESYEQALEKADKNCPLVVFGSLYLAGDIRPLLLSQFKTK